MAQKKEESNPSDGSEKNLTNSNYVSIKNLKVYPVGIMKENVFEVER